MREKEGKAKNKREEKGDNEWERREREKEKVGKNERDGKSGKELERRNERERMKE